MMSLESIHDLWDALPEYYKIFMKIKYTLQVTSLFLALSLFTTFTILHGPHPSSESVIISLVPLFSPIAILPLIEWWIRGLIHRFRRAYPESTVPDGWL